MSQITLKHSSARTLVSVESTNNIEIKVTRYRVIGDGYIWEGISLINPCWASESVFYQVLNAVHDADGVFNRK